MSRRLPLQRLPAGFGLIELMIALVLGLLVMGAAIAVFQSNQNTYRANEGLNRMQENARVAFELLSRDLRAAGGSACSNKALVQTTGAASTAYNDAVVGVNDTNNSLDAARDQVTATAGDDTSYKVTAATSTSVTLDLAGTGITSATDAFKAGDVVLLCNARYAYVVTATSVGTNTLGFAALPGGYVPTNDPSAPPMSVVVARFRDNRWFVGSNGRGGNSLFVSRNGAAADEIAEGVESLRVRYLENRPDGGCVQNTSYGDTAANWGCVSGVRLDMRLRGQNVDGRTFTRDFSNVISLRSRNL